MAHTYFGLVKKLIIYCQLNDPIELGDLFAYFHLSGAIHMVNLCSFCFLCENPVELPDIQNLSLLNCRLQASHQTPNVAAWLDWVFKRSHCIHVEAVHKTVSLSNPDEDIALRLPHMPAIQALDTLTSIGKPCLQRLELQFVTLTDDILGLLETRGLLTVVKLEKCRFYKDDGCQLPKVVEYLSHLISPIDRICIS